MKARYEIDQAEIDKMDVEIAFAMPLKQWRELAEQIENVDVTYPGSMFLAQVRGMIRNIEDTTATRWSVSSWGNAEPVDD